MPIDMIGTWLLEHGPKMFLMLLTINDGHWDDGFDSARWCMLYDHMTEA